MKVCHGNLRAKGESLPLIMEKSHCSSAEEQVLLGNGHKSYGCAVVNVESTSRSVDTIDTAEGPVPLKVRTTFYQDAITFTESTLPSSIIIALVIGTTCGCVAYVYYQVLDYLLDYIWKVIPSTYIANQWSGQFHVLWIPIASFFCSILCGLSIYLLGEPGDLPNLIRCVHEQGFEDVHHVIPMVFASMFTILSGASLGPEAPLVAICAATAGYISKHVFRQKDRNVIRKHTFMGMAGALSAFFGVPLGGSLFALEVTSRTGIEYFEHVIEVVFAGEICLSVFRSLARLPMEAIWRNENTPTMYEADASLIFLGGGLGLLGAGVAYLWMKFHWRLIKAFDHLGLLDKENTYALPRVLFGAVGVVSIGMFLPQTLFWGEWEFPVLATLSPALDLPHVWPSAGLIGFEMDTCTKCFIVGFGKLTAISFTVAGGYRGGFIFPFFTAGAALGRALCFVFSDMSPVIATLCCAAGINVAITRTALATPLILCFLSGELFALPAVLASSIVSLLSTAYVPFMKSQVARSDIEFSLFYEEKHTERTSSIEVA